MRTNCLPGGAEVGRGGWKDIGCEGEVIAIGSPWPGLLQMGFDALDPWVTESITLCTKGNLFSQR